MAKFLKPLGLVAVMALATPVMAQDDAAPAPAAPELDMGTDAAAPAAAQAQLPTSYIDGVFDDWRRECLRNPQGDDPCQITQVLFEDPEANPIGKMTIGQLPAGGDAEAGSMIILPLGTLLTQQVVLGVDSAAPKRYPFRYCTQQGCAAQIGFTAAEVAGFKKGSAAKIVIVPAIKPDATVEIAVSLKGFTAAYDSLATPGSGGEAAPADGADAPTEAPADAAPAQ